MSKMKDNSELKKRAKKILTLLKKEYPDAHCELFHENSFQLLVATILSAQCTDVRVNQVTPILFKKYPTPQKLAQATLADVEAIIRPTGFFHNKAINIIQCAQKLVAEHSGEVPSDMQQLITLPGVGRKTANVILSNAFNINMGVVVDTHVNRLSNLLQLTNHHQPEKIETDLMQLFPKKEWGLLSHLLIFHGRRICIARRPQCHQCTLNEVCPSRKKITSP